MDDISTRGLLEIKQQRLRILREQKATFGIAVPPHIVMEIEQIEMELPHLNGQYRYMLHAPLLETEQPTPAPGLILLIGTMPVLGDQAAQSAFDAIDFHRSRLRHCWLIASGGEHGSLHRAYELRDYFAPRRVAIHIWQVEDPSTIQETYTLVDWIYASQVPASGLDQSVVVADVTGGTKPMTMGMTLACGTNRTMQYMLKQKQGPSLPLLLRIAQPDSQSPGPATEEMA